MNRFGFYLRYAWRSLQRDGTRTLLAGVCIAFGVLSLVSMQSLAKALLSGTLFDTRLQTGGDVSLRNENFGYFNAQQVAQVADWQKQGVLSSYTLISKGSGEYLHSMTSGRVTLLFDVMGIDPKSYPIAGEFTLAEPAGRSAQEVLKTSDDALLTIDVASAMGLHPGDFFVLGGGEMTPTRLKLVGTISATPNQRGRAVYYSLETAKHLENRTDVVTEVVGNLGNAPNAAKVLQDSPLRVTIASELKTSSSAVNLFELMFKGAGVLGLLIGGIGISNTLQVMLARRKLEIAMLKTVGMRSRDLLILIGLETGLIGLIGGLAGGLLGSLLTAQLIKILVSSGAFLMNWSPDPRVLIGSIVLGFFTAVVFGIQAILVSSAVRPIELLRNLPIRFSGRTQAARVTVYAFLALLFGLMVGIVLGSPLEGILIVIGGALLLVILQGVFWVLLWVLLKLPLPLLPMVNMARKNLQQRKRQASLIVIALFAGTFSVTFAAITIYNAQTQFASRRPSDEGYNVMAYTTLEHADAVIAQFQKENVARTYTSYVVNGNSTSIEGRTGEDWHADLNLVSGRWAGDATSAIVPERMNSKLKLGDPLTVEVDSKSYIFTVTGFYHSRFSFSDNVAGELSSIIITAEAARNIGRERVQLRVVGSLPASQLTEATNRLGTALPDSLIFSKADMNDVLASFLRSLFLFAIAVAGLAFVAGAVLIANSTGLTVIERYRDIGIFKAVGYTANRVMRLLLFEYILIGLIGAAMGIVGVYLAVTLINVSQPGANLVIEPFIVTIMVILSILTAVISAAVVAWHPTRVRPLNVLRYE